MATPASSYGLLILLPMYLIEINNLNLFFMALINKMYLTFRHFIIFIKMELVFLNYKLNRFWNCI